MIALKKLGRCFKNHTEDPRVKQPVLVLHWDSLRARKRILLKRCHLLRFLEH